MCRRNLDISKEKYRTNYNQFMKEWAKDIRKWIDCEDAIFYKDGIFDVDKWFDNEDLRPLFILKEVNEADPEEAREEAKRHSEKEDIKNCVNFVGTGEKYGSDPWKGKGMWGRVGILAEALFRITTPNIDTVTYYEEMKAKKDILTAGETPHRHIIKQIAIINLKKIGGGNNTESNKSKSTICFECHAVKFHDKLLEQINMINPTIILCCGRNIVTECIGGKDGYLSIGAFDNLRKIPIINAYHPQQTKTEKFYCDTLKEIKSRNLLKTNNI